MTRLLHPWFSLGFVAIFALQIVNWLGADGLDERRSPLAEAPEGVRDEQRRRSSPSTSGSSTPGQKIYFWAIVVSALLFLVTGIPLWFPATFGPAAVSISYVLHDVAALVMLAGFIVHIYEGTAQQPGTFRAMTRGTVEKRWAWTHHPAWYRAVTGRDPRADYERAVQRQTDTLKRV